MDRRYDFLRVFACFLVVIIHIAGSDANVLNSNWWAGNVYDSLARVSVPIFFMISGAMLLPKAEPLLTFFRKRFWKVIPPLIGWSLFYLWWLHHNGLHIGPPVYWIMAIVRGPTMYHLWFFYAIVGLYLFVPLMRRAYLASSRPERLLVLALWFGWISVYPMLNTLLTGEPFVTTSGDPHSIGYFAPYAGYMFLGAVLSEYAWRKSTGALLFAAGVAVTVAMTAIYTYHLGHLDQTFYDYLAPNVTVAAAGLFMLFLGMRKGPSPPWLSRLSLYSVAIYGVHVFLIDPVAEILGVSKATGIGWVDVPLTAAFVFMAAASIAHLLRFVQDAARGTARSFYAWAFS